jgi:hypothetical protein
MAGEISPVKAPSLSKYMFCAPTDTGVPAQSPASSRRCTMWKEARPPDCRNPEAIDDSLARASASRRVVYTLPVAGENPLRAIAASLFHDELCQIRDAG